MLTAAHLAKGDNLRTVRPEYRPSAVAALRTLQQLEYDEAYWLRHVEAMAPKDNDDKPRR